MEKIYSKVNPELLLHVLITFRDFNASRIEVSDPRDFLQIMLMRANEGTVYGAHKHIEKEAVCRTVKTQECMVVLRGVVMCELYDTDDSYLCTHFIGELGALCTFHGGHSFTILEDHTCMLEFKSGPYEGKEKDKEYINEG